MKLTITHHFANSVLKCCYHRPQPLHFHKHICQLITGKSTDCLDVLCLMADVISADSWAGTIDGVVQSNDCTSG